MTWQRVMLGDICDFKYGRALKAEMRTAGLVSVMGSNGPVGFHDEGFTAGPTIIIGRKGSIGAVAFTAESCWPIDTTYYVDSTSTSQDLKWLYWALQSLGLRGMNKAAAVPGLNRDDAYRAQLPLPPLAEQRRIAEIMDRADELRAKRSRTIGLLDELKGSLFRSLLDAHAEQSSEETLAELGTWQSGGTPSRSNSEYFDGELPWASSGELGSLRLSATKEHISVSGLAKSSAKIVPKGALLLGMYDTAALKSSIATIEMSCNQAVAFGVLDSRLVPEYAYFAIQNRKEQILSLRRGIRQKNLNLSMIRSIRIAVPPIDVQTEFATRVGAIERLTQRSAAHLVNLDQLFSSLQHRAFEGTL
jgi:type I restriction enzyme S subunit